jgi:putative phosphoesterase
VDVVIFGHSHWPVNETINNVLYFNPGSPNDVVRAPYCSYGIINIDAGKISAKIVKVRN